MLEERGRKSRRKKTKTKPSNFSVVYPPSFLQIVAYIGFCIRCCNSHLGIYPPLIHPNPFKSFTCGLYNNPEQIQFCNSGMYITKAHWVYSQYLKFSQNLFFYLLTWSSNFSTLSQHHFLKFVSFPFLRNFLSLSIQSLFIQELLLLSYAVSFPTFLF